MRINHDTVREDLEGAVWPGLKRMRYPKTESAFICVYLRLISDFMGARE